MVCSRSVRLPSCASNHLIQRSIFFFLGAFEEEHYHTGLLRLTLSELGNTLTNKACRADYEHPLAEGFSLRAGNLTLTLPIDTAPDDNAIVCLMGDS